MKPSALTTPPLSRSRPSPEGRWLPGAFIRVLRDQHVRFVLVGGVNTVVGLAWFVLIHLAIGSAGYMVTLVLSHVAAVICAFLLHRTLVFKVHGHFWRDLARFELVNLTALGINAALLPIAVELAGIPVIPAQVLIAAVTVAVSFFGHRGFSFRRPSSPSGR